MTSTAKKAQDLRRFRGAALQAWSYGVAARMLGTPAAHWLAADMHLHAAAVRTMHGAADHLDTLDSDRVEHNARAAEHYAMAAELENAGVLS